MKKYENFCNALENLKDIYKYHEPYDNVVLTGLVGLYEICFEQSWKAIKEILSDQGFPENQTGSPKQILKTAYLAGMIQDQERWLAALNARNNVTHAYNHAVALDIVHQTKDAFYDMFCELKREIDQSWISRDDK
jgi:nucleotidyltransferase substrate binding protein (TIGR01987 family)